MQEEENWLIENSWEDNWQGKERWIKKHREAGLKVTNPEEKTETNQRQKNLNPKLHYSRINNKNYNKRMNRWGKSWKKRNMARSFEQ